MACGLDGPPKSRVAGVRLISLFSKKNVIELETCVVRRTPRAMIISA